MSIYDWENEGGMYEYDDDDNRPVVMDLFKVSLRDSKIPPHVHHIDGTCVRNIYGRSCDERK